MPAVMIDIDDFAALPPFRVMSLADQIGDKVSAMYQLYGAKADTPSTRYHDLVDLHLIIARFPIDAASTVAAPQLQQRRRANLTLPVAVRSPGHLWDAGHRKEARSAKLATRLHALDEALAVLAVFLDPLLDGTRTSGTREPVSQNWTEPLER